MIGSKHAPNQHRMSAGHSNQQAHASLTAALKKKLKVVFTHIYRSGVSQCHRSADSSVLAAESVLFSTACGGSADLGRRSEDQVTALARAPALVPNA